MRRSILLAFFVLATSSLFAQPTITTPVEEFGFQLGADYHLANYRQLTTYWQKLATQSDRMTLTEIGKTAEGRPMIMAIITSPANHRRLEDYRQIAKRLALAQDLDEAEARRLSREGKAVVWIDGGLHATEVLGAQQLMELVYQMVSLQDDETLRFLDDVILLAACANPDGLDLVADWYMRKEKPEERSVRGIPRLYQKYVGHDNNRDFYMVTQPESIAINRVLFREWFPQIAYNHHQTGPAGTILFAPPFRDPFNYNLDPLIPTSLDLVGAAMHNRFVAEGKPGATMRSGAGYSTWWNGGLRTTQYFHNIIGLLTETIGSPNPIEIPFIPRRQLPHNDLPFPIAPQTWHFRQSVDYSITANRAVLDVASRYREHFLWNIYRMGKNSIERGNRDHWTIDAERIESVEAAYVEENPEADNDTRNRRLDTRYYDQVLKSPEERDPRAYILPSDQPDFSTARKFINTLIKNGVRVERARSRFQVASREYPAGSFVVRTAQAFRPHILDMFEPQHHPNDFRYPGGPPIAPYDSAGWTLAFQMGVQFDRILEGVDGPFESIEDVLGPIPGSVFGTPDPAAWLLSHQTNDSVVAVNRLLKAGASVFWARQEIQTDSGTFPVGTIWVEHDDRVQGMIKRLADSIGVDFHGIDRRPGGSSWKLAPVRIGLWDRYGGSMPSGWTRWILEQYEFPFEVIYPPRLDAGDLDNDFDVLIFPSGAISESNDARARFRRRFAPDVDEVPEQWRNRLGQVTVEKTLPRLREFLQSGGTILAIGQSAVVVQQLGLSASSALSELGPQGESRPLPAEKYYVPGSVLRMRIDNRHPLAYGLPEQLDVYFNNNPSFRIHPRAIGDSIVPVGWFDSETPLRSGWAWGEHYLKDSVGIFSARVGAGTLFVFGPEITFRAQPHGTFKLLFNGIYAGRLTPSN